VDGADVPFTVADGHLVVESEATTAGRNTIEVEFVAGEEPLNRADDLLYTLFVPARAHRAFPCFDQPDLKAAVSLTLDIPAAWQAVANGAALSTTSNGPRTRVRFAETLPLPTYLIAFAAGKLSTETVRRDGRELRLFHRETDAENVSRNRDAVFDLHAAALGWLEDYTDVPYPFGKFDIVGIPAFQFSGMEHPGAVLYNAASILLDPSATQNQILDRASLIAHETAHMWFGDVVTMNWFDDVWLKEVLANVMAAKIVSPLSPGVNHELRFFLAHYPAAYSVDRSAGANPIRQELANLEDAGQLYGPIIYRKAPIVMRQLEMIMGEQPFRDGVRDYLRAHAFGNAAWPDLLHALSRHSALDLHGWSRAWVEERGRPTIRTAVDAKDGKVLRLTLATTDPLARGVVWPQQLRITLGTSDGIRDVAASVTGTVSDVVTIEEIPLPEFVLPSGGGLGYGLFVLDDNSFSYLLAHAGELRDPLTRAAVWVTLWDNMLEGRLPAGALLGAIIGALPGEEDEQNLERLLAYAGRAFWRYLGVDERSRVAPVLERTLRNGLARALSPASKAAWFSAFRDLAFTGDAVGWLHRVWQRQETVEGLTFSEGDEIALALELSVRSEGTAPEMLALQYSRIQNPDRRAQFAFLMPALSPDLSERIQAFARLLQHDPGRRQPWVLQSLFYLNHPLREKEAVRFIRPSLEPLEDIQRTSDIFFPMRWAEAALNGHRSFEAAAIVRELLAQVTWPQRLRWIVLTAADELFRAAAVIDAGPGRGASASAR
jgi:aminopeptidase N